MKEFDNDKYKLIIHEEGLLMEFITKKNATIEDIDILESGKILSNFQFGKKFTSLFESSEGSRVSAEARRRVASEEYFKQVSALAIYTTGFYEAIRGNLFSKLHRPVVPTRFFDDREKALKWLKAQR